MSSQSTLPSIEKLEGSKNYGNWKFAMQMYLMHEDLWDCIDIDETGNVKNKDSKKEQKAHAKLCLMVHPCTFVHVKNAKSAREVWQNLKQAYEDKGLSRRLMLLRLLFGLKLNIFNTMDEYVSQVISISQQLNDIDAGLSDEFVAVILLSGLPAEYNPMVMALENSNVNLTTDLVKSKLLQENMVKELENKNETALFTKNKQIKKKIVCNFCGKPGHFAKYCRIRKNNITNIENNSTKSTSNKIASLFCALSVNIDTKGWYVDSGATAHMTNCKNWLVNYKDNSQKEVLVANNEKLYSFGSGDVNVIGHPHINLISDVVYVPNLSANLLSVSKMVEKGLKVEFLEDVCKIFGSDGTVMAEATKINGVYKLDIQNEEKSFSMISDQTCLSVSDKQTHNIWHRRLAHLNKFGMALLKQGIATGIDFSESNIEPCETCIIAKAARLPFPKKSFVRAKEKLELIHSDLCGPISETSHNGKIYLLTFIDDFSRKTFGYFLKNKNEVFETFKIFKNMVENETDLKIKCVRTDNGTEYVNKDLKSFFLQHGIKHQTTVPYSPQQNGVAERANRTIMEKVRAMLTDANLSKNYWAEAANTAIYLKNRSPTKALVNSTPEEKWTGKKVDLNHLKVFGCTAYLHVPDMLRKKLDPKSKKYIFVGYCEESKGYRLIDPEKPKRLVKGRDVYFFESKPLNLQENVVNEECRETPLMFENASLDERAETVKSDVNITEEESLGSLPLEYEEDDVSNEEPRYPARRRAEKQFPDYVVYHVQQKEPITVKEALTGKESEKWYKAMREEYDSILKNQTWELVDLPKGKKAIDCKWVFKIKTDIEGNLERYKARLVAKGFSQQYGVDYDETFSPVVRHSTLRLLIALAAKLNLDIDQMDIKTAFLNGDLKETVYMKQPESFIQKNNESKVCLLKKSLYGLKQAPRAWYEKIHSVLLNIGLQRLENEPCVYYKKNNNKILILALYVDDILIFSNDTNQKIQLKQKLMDTFEMKDLGAAKYILGVRIRRENNGIYIDQKKYIQEILENFNMSNCKPVNTPLEVGKKLEKSTSVPNENLPFQNIIGSLMYLAVWTRPDISYSTSFLSQFNTCYDEEHYKAAKRVLRYLKGTMDYCLFFSNDQLDLEGFVDADWGGDISDRKSYTGYVFKLSGSAVSWESKKQRTVALSSAEAEYMGISEATKEAIFLQSLLKLTEDVKCITLYNDNQSAQKLALNQRYHSRTKHIDIRHHFIREAVESQHIDLKYIPTDMMIADVLTKSLAKPKHEGFCSQLGLVKKQ